MGAYFFDTSAMVKRYSNEVATSWVLGIFRPKTNNRISIVRITCVEVTSALTRKMRGGKLTITQESKASRRFEREIQNKFLIVEVSPMLVTSAMTLARKYGLRGYDAVQLASALEISANRTSKRMTPLVFVSADSDLNSAAAAEGLIVEDPNNHP